MLSTLVAHANPIFLKKCPVLQNFLCAPLPTHSQQWLNLSWSLPIDAVHWEACASTRHLPRVNSFFLFLFREELLLTWKNLSLCCAWGVFLSQALFVPLVCEKVTSPWSKGPEIQAAVVLIFKRRALGFKSELLISFMHYEFCAEFLQVNDKILCLG